jgi:hypothetical protein
LKKRPGRGAFFVAVQAACKTGDSCRLLRGAMQQGVLGWVGRVASKLAGLFPCFAFYPPPLYFAACCGIADITRAATGHGFAGECVTAHFGTNFIVRRLGLILRHDGFSFEGMLLYLAI